MECAVTVLSWVVGMAEEVVIFNLTATSVPICREGGVVWDVYAPL
jgi:hypothetical protein